MIGLAVAIFFAFLGFLMSMPGLFVLLLGLAAFLVLPIIPNATGHFKRLANLHLWLGAGMIGRLGVVVSEHNETILKRMSFDALGVETIHLDGEPKEFEDPDNALHTWMGVPFALADEVHGVLFDPRHAAVGRLKEAQKATGEMLIDATTDEWEEHNIHTWYNGVFELPKGVHELVDLSKVRSLVDGGERAEYPKRVEEIYKLSRDPFQSRTSATRFILLLVALIGPFGAMWLFATQGSVPETSVGFPGMIYLGAALPFLGSIDAGRAKSVAGLFVGVLLTLAPLALVALFVNPLTAAFVALAFGMGFLLMPLLTLVLRVSGKMSGALGGILLRLGMKGYRNPVFEWQPDGYKLKEKSALEEVDSVTWYNIMGNRVGFTFTPEPETWDHDVADTDKLESKAEIETNGNNIPPGYRPAPSIRRARNMAAFLPKRFKSGFYYLNAALTRARFEDSATGNKSLNRLLKSKEEYSGPGGMSDRAMIFAMFGLGVLSFGSGIFIFFL